MKDLYIDYEIIASKVSPIFRYPIKCFKINKNYLLDIILKDKNIEIDNKNIFVNSKLVPKYKPVPLYIDEFVKDYKVEYIR